MDLKELLNNNIEFCNIDTGDYFRAISITEENEKPVVMIEKIEVDYE